MRRKMEKLASQLNKMYLSESYPQFEGDKYFGCKYFIKYHGTNKVAAAAKTQAEMIEKIQDLIENML